MLLFNGQAFRCVGRPYFGMRIPIFLQNDKLWSLKGFICATTCNSINHKEIVHSKDKSQRTALQSCNNIRDICWNESQHRNI